MANKFDDKQQRLKRYSKALDERDLKLFLFQEAYKFALPGRNKWLIKTPAVDKTVWRWDVTAIESLHSFASNLQTILMPPFQNWFHLRSGNINETAKEIVDEELQGYTEQILDILNNSNLFLEANIAFQDMGISTGLLKISLTDNDANPIKFEAIPMNNVAMQEHEGEIKDIWRSMEVPLSDIKSIWPDAKFSSRLDQMSKQDPHVLVKLIEGTIYYPENDPDERYLYYVSDEISNEDLVTQPMEMSPWIPFRFSVSPGETWGFGPILQMLDYIRIANKMTEFDITNAGYQMARPMLIQSNQIVNPYNINMEPGAQIQVEDIRVPPVHMLDVGGDLRFDQLSLTQVQQQIREALFADPLGPMDQKSQTATEVSIRQQNWLQKSTASFARLNNEFLHPVIFKTIKLLKKHGKFKDIKLTTTQFAIELNEQNIAIDFIGPLTSTQMNKDVQSITQFYEVLAQTLGPQFGATLPALMTNVSYLPEILGEKLKVPLELVKSSGDIDNIVQKVLGAVEQAQQAQQPGPPPGGLVPGGQEPEQPNQPVSLIPGISQ